MKATSPRRKFVVVVLLCLAVAGGAIRYWADNPSLLHDLGTLMLVLWLPVIGNVVGYIGNKLPRPAPPPLAFAHGLPFAAHVVVEFTPLASHQAQSLPVPQDPEQHLFTLVVGREGFRARSPQAPASYLGAQEVQSLELEFLRPTQAVHRFPVGTPFRMLWGSSAVGKGTVLETLRTAGGSRAD
ncbi:MAG TPA: hypothetical protein VLJ57_25280 [Burkholderiaceae bacterium]|nr:hypothetical protein [Burkholderiaceae bacterium]